MANAVKNLIFRDVGLVMPNILPFAVVFAGANHFLRKADKTSHFNPSNSPDQQEMRGPLGWALDAAQSLGTKIGEQLGNGDTEQAAQWGNYARGALRTGLLIGSAFTAFNLPYAASKEVYDGRQAKHEARKEGQPEPLKEAPNQQYDALGRGMTTGLGKLVFRDAGSIFLGALALGATSIGLKQLPAFKSVPAKQEGESAPPKDRWLADYVPAGLGYAAFFETVQQFRKAYDGFWKHRDEKQHAKAHGETLAEYKAHQPEKPKARHGFFTEGLGKVVFRDAASVLLGFAPHRYLRMWTNNLLDIQDGKSPAESDNRLVQWIVDTFGGRDNPERASMIGDTLREGVGTGVGFTAGYMLVSEAYRQAYDALFNRLQDRGAAAARG